MKKTRIEWKEQRQGDGGGWELFDVIAERDHADKTGWAFYEKTSWDVTWVRIPATLCRLAKALIEEANLELRLGHTACPPPICSLSQQIPRRTCGVSGKRLNRIGCAGPRQASYMPPAHLDRRMGHASPTKRTRRAVSELAHRGLPGIAGGGDCRDLESAPAEETPQAPSRSRRDSSRRLLIARARSLG